MPESLLLTNKQCPGDFVVMTAALRDLALCYPGRYDVYANVLQPDILVGNPYIKRLNNIQRPRSIILGYDKGVYSVNRSNQNRAHFMWGFIGELNHHLKLAVRLTEFRPAMFMTDEEKANRPIKEPYWVFVSGGKLDYTAKWWDPARWQQVVNRMAPRVKMVQVGGTGGGTHIHKELEGTVDLRGKTSFRQLIKLIYHSEGVVCIVTCLMHIAAAFNKPCVVISGGREPWWWEAYTLENRKANMLLGNPAWQPPSPDNYIPHQYLHTLGQLPCCQNFGCWKDKILPPEVPAPPRKTKCSKPVKVGDNLWLPECLDRIKADDVIQAMEWYYDRGILSWGNTNPIFIPPPAAIAQIAPPAPVQPPPPVAVVQPAKPEPVARESHEVGWVVCGITSKQSVSRATFSIGITDWCKRKNIPSLIIHTGNDLAFVAEMSQKGVDVKECKDARIAAMDCVGEFASAQPGEWLVIVEDPTRLNESLMQPRDHTFVAGTVSWRPLTSMHIDVLRPVLDVDKLDKHPLAPDRYKAYYLGRGMIVGTKALLCRAIHNACQREEYADVLLCEYPRQQGAKVIDIGEQTCV